MPRPIEMHAHDPRRYLGDMLAWVHQSLAGERELMTSLFGGDDGSKSMPRGEAESSVTDMPRTAALLDRVFESICRPLKVCDPLHPDLLDACKVGRAPVAMSPRSELSSLR